MEKDTDKKQREKKRSEEIQLDREENCSHSGAVEVGSVLRCDCGAAW